MDFKVSIIIPIYNVEPYILECLQSVANQTIADKLECILVDDCGTDNSVSVAEEFLRTYSGGIHFELLHHQKMVDFQLLEIREFVLPMVSIYISWIVMTRLSQDVWRYWWKWLSKTKQMW